MRVRRCIFLRRLRGRNCVVNGLVVIASNNEALFLFDGVLPLLLLTYLRKKSFGSSINKSKGSNEETPPKEFLLHIFSTHVFPSDVVSAAKYVLFSENSDPGRMD